jgi:uncharacterized membrane protein required for colicin V production
MVGIEILAAIVVFTLGAIGLVRGMSRELGVTMALVVLLAVFAQFDAMFGIEELPNRVNSFMANVGLATADTVKQGMTVWFFYTAVVLLTAFLAYHGQETLAFRLKNPPGILGVFLGWLMGTLNGYLIFGTIWYYMDRLGYPIRQYPWFNFSLLSDTAKNMIKILPQNVVGGLVMSALALTLLWWRILK